MEERRSLSTQVKGGGAFEAIMDSISISPINLSSSKIPAKGCLDIVRNLSTEMRWIEVDGIVL